MWPDWAIFESSRQQSNPNILILFGLFWKHHFVSKNWYGNFWGKLAYFKVLHLVTLFIVLNEQTDGDSKSNHSEPNKISFVYKIQSHCRRKIVYFDFDIEMIFETENENGFSVKFSPHDSTLLAAVSGSNFGIQGSTFSSFLNPHILHFQLFTSKNPTFQCETTAAPFWFIFVLHRRD